MVLVTVHRDTLHADLGFGRYLLGLTWYGILTGNRVVGNKLRQFDVPVSEADIAIAQQSAQEAIIDYLQGIVGHLHFTGRYVR